MIYRRGKQGTYWYRFRFAARMIHESARTRSKTIAREAERIRRRELEERINGIKKRGLPPTFERASDLWLESRKHLVRRNTDQMARIALKQLLPIFGSKLLWDIDVESLERYQKTRLATGAQGRTINIEVTMRHSEILNLRWRQIDFAERTLTVGRSKTAASTGRLIPLNTYALDTLLKWAGRFPNAEPDHFVFPACENKKIDPTIPATGWRTAWRHARKLAGVECRFHDLRVTCITKLAESQTPDLVIMSVAGHVSRTMLQHYSRIRTDAKRRALEAIIQPIFDSLVHQNDNQPGIAPAESSANLLN